MRKTQSLTISGKNLAEIPDNIFMTAQEEGVKIIDLSKNKLASLPDGCVKLKQHSQTMLYLTISFFFFTDYPIWNRLQLKLMSAIIVSQCSLHSYANSTELHI